MFSRQSSNAWSASSWHSKGKSNAPMGTINCCHTPTERKLQRSRWRSASGCVGSGALLALLPKCPVCIAAYLTLWTGASVAMPIATRLRPMLEILFAALAVLLLVRCVAMRTRYESSMKRSPERNKS